jgi:hypothetical protein
MSIVAWIIVGLIPGFLAGALAAHNRQTARARSDNPNPFFVSLAAHDRNCLSLRSPLGGRPHTGK